MRRFVSLVAIVVAACRGGDDGDDGSDPAAVTCEPDGEVHVLLGPYLYGGAVGDFDGDGLVDSACRRYANDIPIVFDVAHDGPRGLLPWRAPGDIAGQALVVEDFTGDGRDDIVVQDLEPDALRVLAGGADRQFTMLAPFAWTPADHIVSADVDGDGSLDLIGATTHPYRAGHIEAALNSPNGFGEAIHSFSSDPVGFYAELAVGDVDNDGKVDVVGPAVNLGPNVNGIAVMLGDGTGRFTSHGWYRDIPDQYGVHAVFLVDVDDDGTLDMVTENNDNDSYTVGIKRGGGDGTFAPMELFGYRGGRITVGDVTGDGKPDLVAANRNDEVSGGHVYILENVDGAFTAGQAYGTTRFWYQTVLADVDSDGDNDIIGVDESGVLVVMHMQCVARP